MSTFELFSRRASCPYCLASVSESTEPTECQECHKEIPPSYLREHRNLRPLALQIIGWRGHGKTAYLSALVMALAKLGKIWPRYLYSAATEATQRRLQEIFQYSESGRLPPPTPHDADECHVLMIRNMEHWGSRALLLRDCAGEELDCVERPMARFPFLLRAPVSLMALSLADIAQARGRSMEMLMNDYVSTLTRHGVDLRQARRKLVVILTKADLIYEMPAALRSYLVSDPLWAAVNAGESGHQVRPSELNAAAVARYSGCRRRSCLRGRRRTPGVRR